MPSPSDLYQQFFSANAVEENIALSRVPEKVWQENGPKKALDNFHLSAEHVPAYKDFLKHHNINPTKINSIGDFEKVPCTDKESYLTKYPLNELCFGGDIARNTIISSSSGSSGKPFYWPRVLDQDINAVKFIEMHYINNFSIDKISTLLIVCLGMGVWTAGEMMSGSGKLISQKQALFSVITPGLALEEILKILRNVSQLYKQSLMIGYPAYIKDIIDTCVKEGLDLNRLSLKVLVGGEPITEEWRGHVFEKARMKNRLKDITSLLGSSEGGMIGFETPICTLVRRECFKNKEITQSLFNNHTIPSIVQYNPMGKYMESVNNELILTSMGGIPLIRYNTKDNGSVLSLQNVLEILSRHGFTQERIIKELSSSSLWTFPFAYLFGRTNIMTTLYAVNIYPENIKAALVDNRVRNHITGRFAMKTAENKNCDQSLEIFIELGQKEIAGVKLKNLLTKVISEKLKKLNSEYKKLTESVNRKNLITLKLQPFGDKRYFSSDKQKYVITS